MGWGSLWGPYGAAMGSLCPPLSPHLTQRVLQPHGSLRAQQNFGAVGGAEANALLRHLAERRQGNHLETAAVLGVINGVNWG